MGFAEGSSIDSVGETSLSTRDHEGEREVRQRELRSRRGRGKETRERRRIVLLRREKNGLKGDTCLSKYVSSVS
ncbi:hypothetical protein F2Q70_00002068 [Brassica cretica]|uniref:Uncharacterized protein n=1 Tax=Brassica cretica TaxID=69181 RepID=A0A8S9IK68_BRACR|nr:hypothetical protein F2Q70_00002068 [Brassica cretica]